MPHYIRSDNGLEFTVDVFQKWLTKVGIKPIRIYPGSPWENGYNQRFNGPHRRECFGPLKLCQYLLTNGVAKNGTETVFG